MQNQQSLFMCLIKYSIPTRRELVKEAARDPNTSELKASQLESQTHAWTYCPLSQCLLAAPIVSDRGGVLYNKDAIIEYLLPGDESIGSPVKTEHGEVFAGRIKSLRDVVEVKFEVEKSDSDKGEKRICPITSKELGPHTKAIYLVPCGHAFSESAIREVAGDTCLQCNEPYEKENIIPILPVTKEDISRLAERIQRLKDSGLTHSLKKAPGSKKRKKNGTADTSQSITNGTHDETPKNLAVDKVKTSLAEPNKLSRSNCGTPEPQSRSGTATPLGGIKNAATASLTARVLDEQEERNKRRKLGLNDNLKSLFSTSGSNGSTQRNADFMTRGYSIPKKA
jgi:hypothetical protein